MVNLFNNYDAKGQVVEEANLEDLMLDPIWRFRGFCVGDQST